MRSVRSLTSLAEDQIVRVRAALRLHRAGLPGLVAWLQLSRQRRATHFGSPRDPQGETPI